MTSTRQIQVDQMNPADRKQTGGYNGSAGGDQRESRIRASQPSKRPIMPQKRNVILAMLVRSVVAGAVLVLGAGVFFVLLITAPRNEPANLATSAPALQVMRPALAEVNRQFSGFGTGQAMNTADVPAEVLAMVKRVPETTAPGRFVERDDLLVELDAVDYSEQLDRIIRQIEQYDAQLEQLDVDEMSASERFGLADEEVKIAQRDLERVRSLHATSDAKDFELDLAEQRVAVAKRLRAQVKGEVDRVPTQRLELEARKSVAAADQRMAQRNIDRAQITAPISGEIEIVDVEPGEQVAPGQRVVRLVDVQRIEVPIRLPSSAREHVAIGDRAELGSTGAAHNVWSGRVLRIGPADDDSTRTFPVYVEVLQRRDDRPLLTPGTYVEGWITSETKERRMVVPRRAVADGRMFTVSGEAVVQKPVVVDYYVRSRLPELGLGDEDYWAVLEQSVGEGSLIALNGAADLTTGDVVRPVVMNQDSGSSDQAVARDDSTDQEEHSSE